MSKYFGTDGERPDRRRWRSQLGSPQRRMAFVGRGEAKMLVEFPACRKWKSASCASTKRVAAVGGQRRCAVSKAHTGHRNRNYNAESEIIL